MRRVVARTLLAAAAVLGLGWPLLPGGPSAARPLAGPVAEPNGTLVPRDGMNGEVQLYTLFAGRGDAVDWQNDAIGGGVFYPTGPTVGVQLVLAQSQSRYGLAWYNATGSAPAFVDLHTVFLQNTPVGASTTIDVANDPNYAGGPIGFALVGLQIHYSEAGINPSCSSCTPPGPWILGLLFPSVQQPGSYYVAFEDGFVGSSPGNFNNDGDFNDSVILVSGAGTVPPTPTPTPTATATSTSTATATPTVTPTSTSTATGTATSTASPTGTATATPTGVPPATTTPAPTGTVQPTATGTVAPTAAATGTATRTPTAGPPGVTVAGGSGQSAPPGTPFPNPLQVAVDGPGGPVAGANVTFTAPPGGPSCTFPNGLTSITVQTGANGVASTTCTPGGVPGGFQVSAGVAGGGAVTFALAVLAVTPTPVIPEAPPLWLFGSGLLALGWFAKRRR